MIQRQNNRWLVAGMLSYGVGCDQAGIPDCQPKTAIPISFKYSYKFASKATYASVAELPEPKYTYVTGKIGTKAGHVPRSVTLSVRRKHSSSLIIHTTTLQQDLFS